MRLKQCTVTQIENFNRVSLMLPLWFCFLYCLPEIRIFFFILSSLEKIDRKTEINYNAGTGTIARL